MQEDLFEDAGPQLSIQLGGQALEGVQIVFSVLTRTRHNSTKNKIHC